MKALAGRHAAAALGCAVALASGAAALTPGAFAAGQTHTCANKTISVQVQGPQGPIVNKEVIKAISTQGVSCAAADRFLEHLFASTSNVIPEHYKCRIAHFKVPLGYVAEACTHGSKRIQYAGHGG
jgi:hypothetical protein